MEQLIRLEKHGSKETGYLSVFDDIAVVDFPIKRVYYTYGVEEGGVRGNHAHKELKQLLWCPSGAIAITLDDGSEVRSYTLDEPEQALLIPGKLWLRLTWLKADAVLCAAVSDYYSEEDCIRDYEEFLRYLKDGM